MKKYFSISKIIIYRTKLLRTFHNIFKDGDIETRNPEVLEAMHSEKWKTMTNV